MASNTPAAEKPAGLTRWEAHDIKELIVALDTLYSEESVMVTSATVQLGVSERKVKLTGEKDGDEYVTYRVSP